MQTAGQTRINLQTYNNWKCKYHITIIDNYYHFTLSQFLNQSIYVDKAWHSFLYLFFLPLLSPSFQLYPAVVCKASNCSSSIKIQCFFLFSLNNKYVVDVFLHFIAHSTNVWLGMATGKYFLKTESSLRFRKLPQLSDLKKKNNKMECQ